MNGLALEYLKPKPKTLTNACCLLYAPIMGAQRMGRRHSEMRFRDVETRTPTHFLLEPCCGNLGSSWAV